MNTKTQPFESYDSFLKSKRRSFQACGIQVEDHALNPKLFDFQRDIVRWALAKGRSALFLSTGLGKTFIELEWARIVSEHTQGNVLILAPLAVAPQTIREGAKFGIKATLCRSQQDVRPGINIANYEVLEKLDPSQFTGIVLDESSILKSFTSKTRNQIIEAFANTQFRLACTATPAPNDHMELGNHAEFVGVMSRTEMLSMFFVHDGGETSKWRLKGHAEGKFWTWVASWAVMMSRPSDLGYKAAGYDLPDLRVHQITVNDADTAAKLDELKQLRRRKDLEFKANLEETRTLRQTSIKARIDEAVQIVESDAESQWVVWCDLNDESKLLAETIPGAIEVKGSDKPEFKEKAFLDFAAGRIRVLVTKPSIAGFGMNWQNCHKCVFVGLSYSFEQYFQAVRRFYRFGQTMPVDAYIVSSASEGHVVNAINEKEKKFHEMLAGMIASTQEIQKANIDATVREVNEYRTETSFNENHVIQLGDCCELIRDLPDHCIDFSVFSPPFASLYTYSNSERDIGNCASTDEFATHFRYLVSDMIRVMKPGRLVAVHCMQLPSSKEKDGVIGLKDFRGQIIRILQEAGFIYHSEVCIWKNPVVQMQRTKALGLLHKQIRKDSSMSRQGLADYLVVFRAPGQNAEPISHTHETFPVDAWQQFASPVWADINPSATLQYRSARAEEDERHICPLQLPVIERAIALWSNPGDVVFSPFAGIGSEGYQAIKMGRRFLGFELKESYFRAAARNLSEIEEVVQTGGADTSCPKFNVFEGRETYGRKREEIEPSSDVASDDAESSEDQEEPAA